MSHDRHARQACLTMRRVTAGGATIALVAALAACGGGDADEARAGALAAEVIAPLIADDGTPMPADPRAVPVDAGAWTSAQRYATREQAAQLTAARPGDVLEVAVGCCGAEAADLAVWTAYALRAAHDWPRDVPTFVRGDDLRLAASVAERLATDGMTRVWLVTR